jgi:hypothetical protein
MIRTTTTASRHADGPAPAAQSRTARPGARGVLEGARAAWGAALLIGPGTVLEQVHGVRADSRSIAVARLLGARHVAQATLSGTRPAPAILALGVWIDTAHAGTALAFAAAGRTRARGAILDAAVAAGWAAAGLRVLTRSRPPQPAGQWRRDRLACRLLRHLPAGRTLLALAGPPCT